MILFVSYKQLAGAIWLSFYFMACVTNIYIQAIYCNGGRQSRWHAMDHVKSVPLSRGMADDQSSSKSWCSDTNRLEEGGFNWVPVWPASVEETITTRKKQDKEKARISHRSEQDAMGGTQ
jgi:hypothetical protein